MDTPLELLIGGLIAVGLVAMVVLGAGRHASSLSRPAGCTCDAWPDRLHRPGCPLAIDETDQAGA